MDKYLEVSESRLSNKTIGLERTVITVLTQEPAAHLNVTVNG